MGARKRVKIGVRYKISREYQLLAKCVHREVTAAEHLIYETGALKAFEPINQVPVEHHVLAMIVEGVNQDCELGTLG